MKRVQTAEKLKLPLKATAKSEKCIYLTNFSQERAMKYLT